MDEAESFTAGTVMKVLAKMIIFLVAKAASFLDLSEPSKI